MIPVRRPVPSSGHAKVADDSCEIEIRKTRSGKKIKFKGKCSREQLQIASQEAGIDLGMD